MRRLAVLGMALLQLACASAGNKAVFFRATATSNQMIDLTGIQELVVRSSLSLDKLVVRASAGEGRVSGQMVYAIQGYHGTRKDAGVGPVPPGALVFDQERAGSTLILKSREWAYIHHSLLYTTIALSVPEAVHVVAQPYSYAELEKRGGGSN